MKQAILCGKLLNTVKKRVDTDQVILVEDDCIQAVERREAIEIPEGYEIVDCSDRFVTPGLIDAHLHTAFDPMTYLKDYTGDGVIRGLINAKKDLLAGFTTLRDMGCTFYANVSIRNAINSGKAWGPRMKVSGWAISSTGGHADLNLPAHLRGEYLSLCRMANSPDEMRWLARDIARFGKSAFLCPGSRLSPFRTPGPLKKQALLQAQAGPVFLPVLPCPTEKDPAGLLRQGLFYAVIQRAVQIFRRTSSCPAWTMSPGWA